MKILSNIPSVYQAMKNDKMNSRDKSITDKQSNTQIKDKVTLSKTPDPEQVREIEVKFAKQKLDGMPDVRQDRVDSIREQIKNGTYNVELDKVAESILERLI
jgi:negative regulator of flagellin synthesis FlgM